MTSSGKTRFVEEQSLKSLFTISAVNSQYLELDGTIFYKFKLPEVQINLHFGKFGLVKNRLQRQVGESNQNVSLIQKDASSFAEFEISELEISRVDGICFDRLCLNCAEARKVFSADAYM